MSDFLTFAHQLADAAGGVIRPYFGAHGTVEAKGDQSPVTVADREAEAAMRALITSHFPEHNIYGEEFGIELVQPLDASRASEPSASAAARKLGRQTTLKQPNFTWVIDPIDGTRAFIAGRKEWGTLIALCENGIPILGILDQPVTGERWVGVRGEATRYYSSSSRARPGISRNMVETHSDWSTQQEIPGRARDDGIIHTRACASLADAELSTTSTNYFTPAQAKPVVALAQAVRATVKDGDCYAYGLLARGERDLVIDAGLKPYDILALVPIVEGAGGTITDWKGEAITLSNFSAVLAAGDAATHNAAQGMLA